MSETEPNLPIIGKPDPWGWLWVAFFAGIGALLLWMLAESPTAPGERIPLWAFGLAVGAPLFLSAGSFAWWLMRARVIADEWGLRWRWLGRWHLAAWDEVTDYFDERLPAQSGHRSAGTHRAVVETPVGRLILVSLLSNRDALRRVVARHAVHARALAWAEWGLRDEEAWPLVFGYDGAENRSRPWILGGCMAVLLVIWGWMVLPHARQTVAALGWPMALAAALLLTVTLLLAPAVMSQETFARLLEARRRRSHSVLVEAGGIRYRTPEGEIAASWDQVTDYFVGPAPGWVKVGGPSVVVTRNGTFEFNRLLENAGTLRAIIQQRATSASTRGWQARDDERLGDEAACWISGCRGVGQRVVHYRTRANRAMLWFAAGHWLAFAVSAAIGPLREKIAELPVILFGVGLSLGVLWLTWRYFTAAILVDDRGITQRAWNGTRTLVWSQVEELSTIKADWLHFGTISGGGCRVRFWFAIADAEELQALITARAPGASRICWEEAESLSNTQSR